MKAGHHAEEARVPSRGRPTADRRSAARRRARSSPVGGDHVDRLDAHARGAVHAAVPAVSALQQIAAERHARTVARREEQLVLRKRREQLVAVTAGPDGGASSPRVQLDGPSVRDRSSSIPPSRTWLPAQLWPPERTPIRMSFARAWAPLGQRPASLCAITITRGSARACGRSTPRHAGPAHSRLLRAPAPSRRTGLP